MSRPIDAGEAMRDATPTPPPSPAIFASESHKDRTSHEDRPTVIACGLKPGMDRGGLAAWIKDELAREQ